MRHADGSNLASPLAAIGRLLSTLWATPFAAIAAAAVLYPACRLLDGLGLSGWHAGLDPVLLLGTGSADELAAILVVVFSGLLTLFFSITLLVMTLAASTLGIRLTDRWMERRVISGTLGLLVGLVVFAVALQADINPDDAGRDTPRNKPPNKRRNQPPIPPRPVTPRHTPPSGDAFFTAPRPGDSPATALLTPRFLTPFGASPMSNVLTGLFNDEASAAAAIVALEVEGIPEADLSLIASDQFNKDAFAIQDKSKIAEGTALGATAGGAVGALVAGLTAVGAIGTGGAGLLVAGPLVAALAGAGAGAAGGSLIGGVVGFAIPENEIKHHEDALSKGAVLVGVACEDSDKHPRIKTILTECGASKVSHA